jgi:N-acetyl-anhydromuramyl-L-alanine amidase AmpD
MNKYSVLIGLLLLSVISKAQSIIQKPIIFDEERKALSMAYLNERYSMVQDEPTIVPQMVVVHWTVIPTFEASFRTFNQARLPSSRAGIQSAGALNVSSQYMIDRDGTIYQLLADTTFARHVIGLNHCAIGIENIGGTKDLPMTAAQLKSNIELIRMLSGKHDIKYVIGHHEYKTFIGHELWKEKDPNYLTVKSDPGDQFMNDIRNSIKDLGLKGPIKK